MWDTLSGQAIGNAIWIIGCKLLKAILTLVVTIITARYLGPGNYGLIHYAAGVVAFVTPVMKLGLDSVAVYEIIRAPDKEGETLGTILTSCLCSSVLCIAGVVSFAAIANHGEADTVIVCAVYSTLLIFQALELIQYWFQAKLLAKYSSIAMLIAYVVVTVVQTILILRKANIYLFALSHSIDFAVIAGILFWRYYTLHGQKMTFSANRARALLSISKYYIVSSVMVTVFQNTDRVMLKIMAGNEATGYYSAACTCASMTSFVFAAIIDSMRPVIFQAGEDPIQFKNHMVGLYSIVIYTSLIQCLLLTVLAEPVVLLMYGDAYKNAILLLRLVVWFTTFSYLGTVRNVWILSQGLQKHLWRINLSGAFMNVLINWVLIPRLGAAGAAIASIVTQVFTNVFVGFFFSPIRENNRLMIEAIKPRNFLIYTRGVVSALGQRVIRK